MLKLKGFSMIYTDNRVEVMVSSESGISCLASFRPDFWSDNKEELTSLLLRNVQIVGNPKVMLIEGEES